MLFRKQLHEACRSRHDSALSATYKRQTQCQTLLVPNLNLQTSSSNHRNGNIQKKHNHHQGCQPAIQNSPGLCIIYWYSLKNGELETDHFRLYNVGKKHKSLAPGVSHVKKCD